MVQIRKETAIIWEYKVGTNEIILQFILCETSNGQQTSVR